MNTDRVKGLIDEMVGNAKHGAGELTGNTRLQVKGIAEQMKGKLEGSWGKARDTVHDAVENADVRTDTHVKLDRKNPRAESIRNKNCDTLKP